MAKKKLGRGLDALLRTTLDDADEAAALRDLPVEQVQRGRYQPREDMDPQRLEELAASIRAQGVVQPIVVRPIGPDRYEIIAGERRWRAAQLAGLHEIPAVVRDVPDEAAVAMSLIENIQREELSPMEEANALQRLIDEFQMTHQQVAEAIGRSRTAVTNLLRLQGLHPDVKRLLNHGDLEMGHARALLALPRERQPEAAHRVVTRGLSVRQTEQMVKRLLAPRKAKDTTTLDPDVRRLQERLSERLGAPVRIVTQGKNKGRLEIRYSSLEELDGILERIG